MRQRVWYPLLNQLENLEAAKPVYLWLPLTNIVHYDLPPIGLLLQVSNLQYFYDDHDEQNALRQPAPQSCY